MIYFMILYQLVIQSKNNSFLLKLMSGLTKQLALELIQLIKNDKKQVKYGALNAILQYAQAAQQKQLFVETDLCKMLLKNVFAPQLTKICLSNLINISSESVFEKQLVQFVQPLCIQLKQWNDPLIRQLALLFLLNASQFGEVINKILGEEEKKGYVIEILYSLFQKLIQKQWIICNIFANISSTEEGRNYFCQQKIHIRFLPYLLNKDEKVRLALSKLFRNMAFLWENENFVTQILQEKYKFIDTIASSITMKLYKMKLLPNDEEKIVELLKKYELLPDGAFSVSQKEYISNIELEVDILIILSNCNFPERKPKMLKQELKQLISLLKFTKISQETKDKLQALETFCFW